jgi:hypothetical protein
MPTIDKRRFARKARLDDQDKLNILAEFYVAYKSAFDLKLKKTEDNYNHLEGNSWEKVLKKTLEDRGYPAIEVNIILPRMLNAIGQFIENHGRLTTVPFNNAGEDDSVLANAILDWSNPNMRRDYEVMRAYADAIIGDMPGALHVFWDTRAERLGVPTVKRLNPLDLIIDPSADIYDEFKHRYRGVKSWWTFESMFQSFPKKRAEIEAVIGEYDDYGFFSRVREKVSEFWPSLQGDTEIMRDEFIDIKENMGLVMELHTRESEVAWYAYDQETGEDIPDAMTKGEALALFKEFGGRFTIEEDERDQIYTHITFGDYVLLSSEKRKIQNGYFPIFLLGGLEFQKNMGIVGQLKGLQKQYQYNISARLSMLLSSAISGYWVEKDSLDEEQRERLEEEGTNFGYVGYYNQGRRPPQRIEPPQIPQSDFVNAESIKGDVNELAAVGYARLGHSEGGQENATLNRQRVQNSLLNFSIFNLNAAYTETLVGQYILALAERHLSAGRALNIVGEENIGESVIVPEGVRLSHYLVQAIAGNRTPTQRLYNALELEQFMQYVAPEDVPKLYPYLTKYSLSIPEKNEITEILTKGQGISADIQAQIAQIFQETAE